MNSTGQKGNFQVLFYFKRYGGHTASLLVYFIFWSVRAKGQTQDCLTAARRATCGLRHHPVGYVATLFIFLSKFFDPLKMIEAMPAWLL